MDIGLNSHKHALKRSFYHCWSEQLQQPGLGIVTCHRGKAFSEVPAIHRDAEQLEVSTWKKLQATSEALLAEAPQARACLYNLQTAFFYTFGRLSAALNEAQAL